MTRPFIDANVLIYAALQPDSRATVAREITSAGGQISVQVMNEFVAVARGKLKRSWPEIDYALGLLRTLHPRPLPITLVTHRAAVEIAARYGLKIYDATIIASALEARCDTLFTEDMQDGQVIEDRLTIRNPFLTH